MKKIIALIKKDIKIQFKNPITLLVSLGFPLIYLFLFSFMAKTSTKELKFYVDQSLSHEFDNQEIINSSYLESPIEVNVFYMEKEQMLRDFEKGKLAVIYYEDNGEKIIFLNTNKSNSSLVYNVLREKFYPIEVKKFKLKKIFSMNYALLSMVFNFLLIFGSMSYGSNFLYHELKKQNILLLLKSGISKSEILFSKLLGVLVLQILAFSLFFIIGTQTGMLEKHYHLFLYLPLIILPSAMLGLFFTSITSNDNIRGLLPMFLWLPSVFFNALKEDISATIIFFLKLNPLVVETEFIEQVIRKDITKESVLFLIGSSIVMFVLSQVFLKRTIVKSM